MDTRLYQVLVVDDDQPVLDWLVAFPWDTMGCELLAGCQNGAQALDVARNNPPDILITDIVMPIMDGLELTRELKAIYPEMEVILLSSYREFDYARRALQLDVRDYLLKGIFDETELRKIVEDCKDRLPKQRAESGPLSIKSALLKETASFYASKKGRLIGKMGVEEREKMRDALTMLSGDAWREYVCREFSKRLEEKRVAPDAVRSFVGEWIESVSLDYGLVHTEGYINRALQAHDLAQLISVMEDFHQNIPNHFSVSVHADIARVIVLMRQNYAKEFTLEQAAALVGYSTNYLGTRFLKETGMGFREYLMEIRMKKARELLRTTSLKVYEVAELVGYPSYRYFTRVFKRYFGQDPSQVRRKTEENQE